jgi:hypothetical protein
MNPLHPRQMSNAERRIEICRLLLLGPILGNRQPLDREREDLTGGSEDER